MTRINAGIDVVELLDTHLFREWQELPRVLTLAVVKGAKGAIPPTFRLGTGHMCFFYDKLEYLAKRFDALTEELEKRGTADFDRETAESVRNGFKRAKFTHPRLWNDWDDKVARNALKERLHERFETMTDAKFRYLGEKVDRDFARLLIAA